MSKENPNYYAIISADVRYDKQLKANEKLLYGEITALSSSDGYCWASNRYFANLYDVSSETVSRWISKLEKYGYIKREIIKGDNNQVIERKLRINSMITSINNSDNLDTPIDEKINTPIDENVNTPIDENVNTPIDEKVKENNTSKSNNTSNNNISVQKQVFEYWITKSEKEKALVKHQKYADTFEKAINKAIKIYGKDLDKFKLLIDRFIICFKKSQDTGYPIRSRSFYGFFGQKHKDGVILICQEYDDDGSKWLWYLNPTTPKKQEPQNKFVNYNQREYDFDELEKKALEMRMNNQGGG